jgi:hypothetical protein
VACEAHEREKLERLCCYITRPAVSTERLSLTTQGNIRYRLKTPYRDGTTDVVFEPLDNIAPGDLVKIDILTCEHCGGAVKVIASMEDPAVIKQVLEHLDRRTVLNAGNAPEDTPARG